jgi:transposase
MKVSESIAKRKKICEMAKKHSITWISEHYGVSRPTIYRWLKRYNGSKDSLKDKSKKPLSHPNQCTKEEVEIIIKLWKKHKQFGVDYIYGLLKRKKGFKRCRETVYNVLRRENCHYKAPKRRRNRAGNKEYHGAKIPGEKLQMDVKYVPTECLVGDAWQYGKKYYQWTIIDEATSLRFTEFYDDKWSGNSVDFVQKAKEYFPFELKKIQTDNGKEFTNKFSFTKRRPTLKNTLQKRG